MIRLNSFILMVVCSLSVSAAEPKVEPKAKVELRWLESKKIEGLTENEGFQCSCDPKSIVYPHRKPALVLTAVEVSEAKLTKHDFSKNNMGIQYMVAMHLTKDARKKLAGSIVGEGKGMRLLTVVVDGKYWGVTRYEIDPKTEFAPAGTRSDDFLPEVGFISNEAEAQRLVDAFKK